MRVKRLEKLKCVIRPEVSALGASVGDLGASRERETKRSLFVRVLSDSAEK